MYEYCKLKDLCLRYPTKSFILIFFGHQNMCFVYTSFRGLCRIVLTWLPGYSAVLMRAGPVNAESWQHREVELVTQNLPVVCRHVSRTLACGGGTLSSSGYPQTFD